MKSTISIRLLLAISILFLQCSIDRHINNSNKNTVSDISRKNTHYCSHLLGYFNNPIDSLQNRDISWFKNKWASTYEQISIMSKMIDTTKPLCGYNHSEVYEILIDWQKLNLFQDDSLMMTNDLLNTASIVNKNGGDFYLFKRSEVFYRNFDFYSSKASFFDSLYVKVILDFINNSNYDYVINSLDRGKRVDDSWRFFFQTKVIKKEIIPPSLKYWMKLINDSAIYSLIDSNKLKFNTANDLYFFFKQLTNVNTKVYLLDKYVCNEYASENRGPVQFVNLFGKMISQTIDLKGINISEMTKEMRGELSENKVHICHKYLDNYYDRFGFDICQCYRF